MQKSKLLLEDIRNIVLTKGVFEKKMMLGDKEFSHYDYHSYKAVLSDTSVTIFSGNYDILFKVTKTHGIVIEDFNVEECLRNDLSN